MRMLQSSLRTSTVPLLLHKYPLQLSTTRLFLVYRKYCITLAAQMIKEQFNTAGCDHIVNPGHRDKLFFEASTICPVNI